MICFINIRRALRENKKPTEDMKMQHKYPIMVNMSECLLDISNQYRHQSCIT